MLTSSWSMARSVPRSVLGVSKAVGRRCTTARPASWARRARNTPSARPMSACARAWVIARPDASVEHALFDHLVCVTSFLSLSRIAKRGHSQETAKLRAGLTTYSRTGVLCKWLRTGGGRGIRTPKGLAARWISSSPNDGDYRPLSATIGNYFRVFLHVRSVFVTIGTRW